MTSARKVILVGDINQNRPFTLDLMSEFSLTNETSLMERLMKTGIQVTRLLEQFRIHPNISASVSKYFYSQTLRDSLTVSNRPEEVIWRRFRGLAFASNALSHSYFVHTPYSLMYPLKEEPLRYQPSTFGVHSPSTQFTPRSGRR